MPATVGKSAVGTHIDGCRLRLCLPIAMCLSVVQSASSAWAPKHEARTMIDNLMVRSGTFRRASWAAVSLWLLLGLLLFSPTACRASDSTHDTPAKGANATAAAATPPTSSGAPIILLFTGRGTSPNDVAALERI